VGEVAPNHSPRSERKIASTLFAGRVGKLSFSNVFAGVSTALLAVGRFARHERHKNKRRESEQVVLFRAKVFGEIDAMEFGRHEVHHAHQASVTRDLEAIGIHHRHHPALGDEDVLGIQVTDDHAMGVQGAHRSGNLLGYLNQLFSRPTGKLGSQYWREKHTFGERHARCAGHRIADEVGGLK
jgi:hypothetical protein